MLALPVGLRVLAAALVLGVLGLGHYLDNIVVFASLVGSP